MVPRGALLPALEVRRGRVWLLLVSVRPRARLPVVVLLLAYDFILAVVTVVFLVV